MTDASSQQPLYDLLLQITSNGTTAIMIVAFVQWLKESPWFPAINQESTKINQLLGAALAAVASLGISYSVSGRIVTIAFDYVVVLHGLWHYAQQLAMQHFVYHGFLKPREKPQSIPIKVGTTGTIEGK